MTIRNGAPPRLTIYNLLSQCHYLLNTDAEISGLAASRNHNLTLQSIKLAGANSSSIRTLSYRRVNVSLGLRGFLGAHYTGYQDSHLRCKFPVALGLLVNLHIRSPQVIRKNL